MCVLFIDVMAQRRRHFWTCWPNVGITRRRLQPTGKRVGQAPKAGDGGRAKKLSGASPNNKTFAPLMMNNPNIKLCTGTMWMVPLTARGGNYEP